MFDVIEGKILVFSVFEIPPSRPSSNSVVFNLIEKISLFTLDTFPFNFQ